MRILKFGGSSLADAARIGRVADLVTAAAGREPVTLVVSALGGVTDSLERAAKVAPDGGGWRPLLTRLRRRHLQVATELGSPARVVVAVQAALTDLERRLRGVQLVGECSPPVRDAILAAGERLSAPLMVAALTVRQVAAAAVDGTQLIATDDRFGGAAVVAAITRRQVRRRLGALAPEAVPVVTGFLGAAPDGRTTTLGRGGSDLTATVLGAALDAAAVEIWTDVDGVLTAPPRLCPGARTIPWLAAEEARELAFFGATVLCRRTLEPLAGRAIPVVVRNSFRPLGGATAVIEAPVAAGPVALAAIDPVTVREVGENAVCDATDDVLAAVRGSAAGSTLLVERGGDAYRAGFALLAVVGAGVDQRPGVLGRVLGTLERHRIAVRAALTGASACSLSVVIERCALARALAVVHEALMLDRAVARRSHWEVGHEATMDSGGARRDRCGRTAARPPAA